MSEPRVEAEFERLSKIIRANAESAAQLRYQMRCVLGMPGLSDAAKLAQLNILATPPNMKE